MTPIIPRKWRPSLGTIVFAVLLAVASLPLAGLFFFRLYENQLIRQTESELIAQSAVLAAAFVLQIDPAFPKPIPFPSSNASVHPDQIEAEHFHPIEPALDLAGDDILPRRPDARPAEKPVDPAVQAIGLKIHALALQAQDITLAGYRILDANGTVLAGGDEVGQSLAHLQEVDRALRGEFSAVMRVRLSHAPPPPLYSLSRGTGVRIFTAMPVMLAGKVIGVIYASRTPSNILKHLYEEHRKVALALILLTGVVTIIGWVFVRTITQPIRRLMQETQKVGNGGHILPPRHHGTREIALLSQNFVDMAQRLSERSAYIASFAAHVSHELKSPLTAIHGAAELMQDNREMAEPQRQRFLANIIADTSRLTDLLERLRDLARADNVVRDGQTTITPVLQEMSAMFPGLAIQVQGDTQVPIAISHENLAIILAHLADNSQAHGASTWSFQVTASRGEASLAIADNGTGISPGNRARVFDAFFTTRRETGGTGMGLHIVQALLRAHGGGIVLVETASGTALRLRLPLAKATAAAR